MIRIAVADINAAPVASGSATLAAVAEDTADPAGDTVANLFGGNFSDANGDNLAGVAVVANNATGVEGVWQFYDGASWVTIGSPSANNALTLAADAKLRFLPVADFNGAPPTLSVYLMDDSNGSVFTGGLAEIGKHGGESRYSDSTVTLSTSITAVNDAPSLTGTLSAAVAEGYSHTITASELGYSDPDDGDSGVTFTVSDFTNGTLTVDGHAATSFTGTELAGGLVAFVHDGSETSFANFKVSVEDGNEDGSTPEIKTFSFKVSAVNDAPVAGGSATLAAVDEDTAAPAGDTVANLFGANFSDADGDSLAGVAVTANNATGAEGVWQYYDGSSWISIGSPTAGTALVLAADAKLRFLPAADFNGTAPALSAYLIDDSNGPVSTGQLSEITNPGGETRYSGNPVTLSTSITAVNDAPVLTGLLSATVAEGDSHTITTAELGYSDPDDVDAGVTFTVSSLSHGTLMVDGKAATSFTGVQLAAGLVAFVHDGSETSSAGFNVSVEDGNEDESAPTSKAFTFKVDPVNDAPTGPATGILLPDGTEDNAYAVSSDTLLTGFTDADDKSLSVIDVKVSAGNASVAGDSKSGYTITPDKDFNGDVTLSYTVTDGHGGDISVTRTLRFDPINDAPVLTGSLSATVAEGASHTITASELGYNDPDDSDEGVTFTASDLTHGTLMVDGKAATSFTGDQLAAGKVAFVHDGSETTAASFHVAVEDGNEDNSTPISQTFTFKVDPVNEAPELLNPLFDQRTTENTPFTFAVPADTFGDDDAGDVLTYKATMANGDPLPSWLSFDPKTNTFSGTPHHADIGSMSVTVIATDQGGLSASSSFNLAVATSGGGLGGIVLSDNTVKENSDAGTVVGKLSVPDAAPGDTLTYRLSSNPDHAFAIVDGKLVVADGAELDFETMKHYHITVKATESDGSRFRESFVIDLSDVVETPIGTPKNDILIGDAGRNDIHGRQGADIIKGMGGDDRLRSDLGNDHLFGNSGADTFFFGPYAGHDVVEDFDPGEGDRINLKHTLGIEDFKDLMKHHIEVHGSGVLISADHGSLYLKHVKIDDLSAEDFIF